MAATVQFRRARRATIRATLAALGVIAAVAIPTPPSARAQTPAIPIQQTPGATALLPQFIGTPAIPQPFAAPDPPAHPYEAANGRSGIHDDAYQSDTYRNSGPLGIQFQVLSTDVNAECASLTFDRLGRLVTVCVGAQGPMLYMFDPHTLATLATFMLPARQAGAGAVNFLQDFSGGGYFYLDNRDQVVIPTTDRHIQVIAETGGPDNPGFRLVNNYDLTPYVASSDKITSALPDWSGRIWYESFNGVVGAIDSRNGVIHSKALGEEAENSFAVDETNGVYVVTDRALYRLQAASDGSPRVSWRSAYPNSGIRKPGQVDAGSGTTPTIQDGFVTITDNADPLDIVVFGRGDGHHVCTQPIFHPGSGADENSLIGAGHTMIAENNYGYSGPAATEGGRSTVAGIARVDINADGRGCHLVWQNDTVSTPTVVSKLSLANGLIYTYTKDAGSPLDPWYFTALSVHTGQLVYKQLAGTGFGFNNNYAPVTIGPDGSAYVGVLGGLVELRDATAPQVPLAPGVPPARTSTARGCSAASRSIRIPRPRHGSIARVDTYLNGRLESTLRGRRLTRIGLRDLNSRNFRVRIVVFAGNGDRTVLTRSYRNCRSVASQTRHRRATRSPRFTG